MEAQELGRKWTETQETTKVVCADSPPDTFGGKPLSLGDGVSFYRHYSSSNVGGRPRAFRLFRKEGSSGTRLGRDWYQQIQTTGTTRKRMLHFLGASLIKARSYSAALESCKRNKPLHDEVLFYWALFLGKCAWSTTHARHRYFFYEKWQVVWEK